MTGRTARIGRGLLVFLLTLLLFPVLAAPADLPIADFPQRVVVGGDRDYPPYEFADRDGRPAGFNVELTRAVARVMGMEVTFRLGGWKEMRDALQEGRVDLLQGISFSAARTRSVDFSPPHSIVSHSIFARRYSPPARSLDDLKGKEVIVFQSGIMHDLLVEKGLARRLILTATPAEALRLLASGQHDYAVVATLPGTYLIRDLKLTNLVPSATGIAFYPYGYAVRKGDAALLARFSEGLAILKNTGEYQKIHDRWLGVLEPQPVSWRHVARSAAVIVVPLVVILCGTVLWSHSLREQVAIRTASLEREVKERERAVEELRRKQEQLIQADKMKSLGTLVSGVAHEINNPTGLILLNLPILKDVYHDADEVLDERYQEGGEFQLAGLPYSRMRDEVPRLMEESLDAARRIKRIVEDLKDFARREDTGVLEPVDLNEMVRTAVRLVDRAIRSATTRFVATYGGNLPLVRANPQRIEQVVVNLILNACQALPDRERGVCLETRRNGETGWVELLVRDEGVGVAPEHLASLTDPFFTTKRESGGTGLGLSVSAGIVEEHGGTLSFESTSGGGTTVTLTLPPVEKSAPFKPQSESA